MSDQVREGMGDEAGRERARDALGRDPEGEVGTPPVEPLGPMAVITDAGAGEGRVAARVPDVLRTLQARGLAFTLVEVAGGPAVEEAARDALTSGHVLLVVVGDDRSIHHAVNGMINDDAPRRPDATLGVIAAESGSDFVQTFGLPGDVSAAAAHLDGPNVFPIDIGTVTCMGPTGGPVTRAFANVAQAGLGGAVARRLDRMPRRLGRSRRFLAFWVSLATFRPSTVKLLAGERGFEGTATSVFVANGQYTGGGMRISPRSWPGDGLLDVLVMTGPRSEAFTLLPSIFRGEHLPHPHIVEMKARSLTIETDRPWFVEADGVPLGTTPATFGVIRQPIRLKI